MTRPAFRPHRPKRVSTQDGLVRGRAFDASMQERRSVRHFCSDAVPREMIELAIRTAGSAPSGAHLQPWRFVAVSDPATKTRIRKAAEAEERENYGGRMPERWLEDLRRLGTDAEKPFLEIAPWLVVVFRVNTRPDGRPNYYVHESVGIACGLLLASLHLMGLATLTHTPSPMRFLNEILERPPQEKPHLLIPVGYPSEDCIVPELERLPLEEILVVRDRNDREKA